MVASVAGEYLLPARRKDTERGEHMGSLATVSRGGER
jgi:hypothetical protein